MNLAGWHPFVLDNVRALRDPVLTPFIAVPNGHQDRQEEDQQIQVRASPRTASKQH